MPMERRPLTQAQQMELERLNTMALQAQKQLKDFLDYLRMEHGAAAADGWVIEDITQGFVRDAGEDDEDDGGDDGA